MITLRPYQEKAVSKTWEWMTENSGNPLIVMATGLGKSVVNAELCRQALEFEPDMRIICATHSTKLVEQNFQKFFALCPQIPSGLFAAKLKKRQHRAQILFASIQSVYKKPELMGCRGLMIIDECHTLSRKSESMWGKFISGLKLHRPDMRIIGLSATPYRMDSGMLCEGEGAMFAGISYEYGILEGINDGWLSPIVPKWMNTTMDVTGVHKRRGEFIEAELQAAVDKDEITKGCVDEIVSYGADRKTWLVFCTGVAHCEHVAEEIRSRGIECAIVHDGVSNSHVESVYNGLKSGAIRSVCSVEMMTTGVDIPNVDLIAFMRPSASGGLVVQMAGRGTRLCAGKKNCLLLDFARNTDRHGPIDKIRGKSKSEGTGIPPMKSCPECATAVQISVMVCPDCGYIYPEAEKEEKIETNASDAPALSNQYKTDWHEITDVYYMRHPGKNGKKDTLRVDYYNGVDRVAGEWICIDHPDGSWAHNKAQSWWKVRNGGTACCYGLDLAIKYAKTGLSVPEKILVKKGDRFPEIIGYGLLVSPQELRRRSLARQAGHELNDEEIPF